MTKRVKRTRDLEVAVAIQSEDFLKTPHEGQRNWLLNRALKEFVDNLNHLNKLAKSFVPGNFSSQLNDRTQGELNEDEIMEDWQIPVMKAMAEIVAKSHGSVLEVGFGRGIASTYLQDVGVSRHTIIECNDSVVERYKRWKNAYSDRDIELVHGKWQDVLDDLPEFDGILFHTYPLNQEEFVEQVAESNTFAEHFFVPAARHLREGGVFSYFTGEIDSLSRGHQRSLFRHFRQCSLSLCRDLELPEDTRDALWSNSIVIVQAVK